MGRNKKEGGAIVKSFTLTKDEVELMEFDKNKSGFKFASDYMGWLIRLRNQETNPAEYLKQLSKDEELLNIQLEEIRKKREEAIKNISLTKEIELAKNKKRPEAIKILQKQLIEGGIFQAEQTAKTWGLMLNCSPTELLFEALKNNQLKEVEHSKI
jgi:predicted transcriptional regulator YheO